MYQELCWDFFILCIWRARDKFSKQVGDNMVTKTEQIDNYLCFLGKCADEVLSVKEKARLNVPFGWDSWTRTSKTGVKVPCVTVTPYPIVSFYYIIAARLLTV